MLVEAVGAQKGVAEDERIFLVSAATRSKELVEGRDRRRELRVVLGTVLRGPDDDAAGRIERLVMRPLTERPAFDDREEVRRFEAARLTETPEAGLGERVLRRRFQIIEYRLTYDGGLRP